MNNTDKSSSEILHKCRVQITKDGNYIDCKLLFDLLGFLYIYTDCIHLECQEDPKNNIFINYDDIKSLKKNMKSFMLLIQTNSETSELKCKILSDNLEKEFGRVITYIQIVQSQFSIA